MSGDAPAPVSGEPVPPERWVPVDRRFLGLDRRTILPGILALLLVMVFGGVLPVINNAVSFDQEAKAGDVITLGGGISFAPAVGWGIEKGTLTNDKPRSGLVSPIATVVDGGVNFTVRTGPFRGTANQLLTIITRTTERAKANAGFHATSRRATVTTSQGEDGVVEGFTSADSEGALFAFVFGGTGVQITAIGPPGTVRQNLRDVSAMVASLSYEPGSAS